MSLFGVLRDAITGFTAKISENRGMKVNPFVNTSIPVDLYFIQALGLPPTTLSVATAEGDLTITVVSAVNFAVGECCLVLNAASDRFYFAEVLGIAGQILTVDSPLDFAFDIGDTVLAATRELNVDGSVTPQIFEVQAGGVASTLRVDITRIMYSMTSTLAMDDAKFGGITALTNGIVLRRNNGVINNLYNVKSNSDFGVLAFDKAYSDRAPAGSFGLNVRSTFAGVDKHGTTLRLETGDSMQLVISDDLTGLSSFRVMAQGNIIDETAQ